jgi:hypothetical protein
VLKDYLHKGADGMIEVGLKHQRTVTISAASGPPFRSLKCLCIIIFNTLWRREQIYALPVLAFPRERYKFNFASVLR